MIDLTSKLGEINDIEHNKGSKIYPKNQVILDCIIQSIPLKHKCLSIILIWVIVSHKYGWSLKKSIFFFYFSQIGKTDMVLGKNVGMNGAEIWPLEKGRKSQQKLLFVAIQFSSQTCCSSYKSPNLLPTAVL